ASGNTAGRHRSPASRDRQDRRAGGGAGAPFSAWIRADRQHARGIRRPDPMGNRQVGEGHSHGQHQDSMTVHNRMIFSASEDGATTFRRDRGHWYHPPGYTFTIGTIG